MKPGALWPLALAGVLGVTVLANVWMLYAANDRNAAVVEPEYYRKALNYDSTMAQQQANATLGWQVDLDAQPIDPDGNSVIEVRLLDEEGAPVTGATVIVTAIHNLAAAQRPQARLAATANDSYAGAIALRRPGFWELRIEIVRGADRFTHSLRRDVSLAPHRQEAGSS